MNDELQQATCEIAARDFEIAKLRYELEQMTRRAELAEAGQCFPCVGWGTDREGKPCSSCNGSGASAIARLVPKRLRRCGS